MYAAADTAVLTFRILANANDVDVRGGAPRERRADAGQQTNGSEVDVLHQPATQRQEQFAGGDVIRNVWIANRAEIDRVELQQLIDRVAIHHAAVAEIEVAAPRERRELQREAVARGGCGEHVDARGDDFLADTVAGKHCDAVSFHRTLDPISHGSANL